MKKISIFILIAFSLFGTTVSFANTDAGFSDVQNDSEYYDAIDYLKTNEVVKGYDDGTFKPENEINRAEFLKIVIEAYGYDVSDASCNNYKDIKKTDWFYGYVCKATSLGIVKGYGDGTFKAANQISFAEASKMIVNGLKVADVNEDSANVWYEPYVSALENKSAIPVAIMGFSQKISRAEMAEMVYRIKDEVNTKDTNTYRTIGLQEKFNVSDGGLKTFSSCSEMGDYFELSGVNNNNYFRGADDMVTTAVPEAAAEEKSSSEYSETNVQVAGVDEADIVKNDGEYIYSVSTKHVSIIKAYPVSQMQEVKVIDFDDADFNPQELFLDKNKLVVIGNTNQMHLMLDQTETQSLYPNFSGSYTKMYLYDISDKTNPLLKRELSIEGDYSTSRKIDNMVYMVSSRYISFPIYSKENPDENDFVPLYKDSLSDEIKPVSACGKIMYMPSIISNDQYLIVSGIDISDYDSAVTNETVLGASDNVYASLENLYVAQSDAPYYMMRFGGESRDQKTIVHKFALGDSAISYKGKGEVKGMILNQFSMDEHDGYFRIATTNGDIWSGNVDNNLYILDDKLEPAGSIEGVAPGEKIYSVRFLGDKAYMVTFKKVDPLFVIDVKNPREPKILGKLKIPGYSDYLHPYDENHIIGFGKDAVDASSDLVEARNLDFAWYQGIKIAMFDVTDVENPKELHKVVIGDRGTDSELLYNHKALLFDKEKGIMALPITLAVLSDDVKNDANADGSEYGNFVYQGAYVYDVSIADGFKLKGRITHYDDTEIADKSGGYWYGAKDIKRILYIGDYFYTVSMGILKANKMGDLEEIKSIELLGN
ncbi:MAG: beta-propeller domain-containing protein [Candidatus Gracilibacteria bacterium]|jgi:uncharacterized secreted protein with C-terminal beta-propeller domain